MCSTGLASCRVPYSYEHEHPICSACRNAQQGKGKHPLTTLAQQHALRARSTGSNSEGWHTLMHGSSRA